MKACYAYTVGMNKIHTVQYTIRRVPLEVDRRLRARAARSGTSLNRELLGVLERAAGASSAREPYRDLDAFFGSWTADAEVDASLSEQRRVDRALWR